jgi:thiol-disulfide isomerase/thioredoxin
MERMEMRIGSITIAALCLTVVAPTLIAAETAGIGLALKKEGEAMVVMRIFPDTPAAETPSIQIGDKILAVGQDNKPAVDVAGLTLSKVVELLRGPKGSNVRLTIVPAGKAEQDARVVSLVRGELQALARWGDGIRLQDGARVPDIEMFDLASEKTQHLADFSGQIVVLKFWSTWCGPCQQQIADLQALAAGHPEWKGKVAFITASIDDEMAQAAEHVKEKDWSATQHAWVREEAVKAFHVNSLPTTYVIDARGSVAAFDPAGNLADALKELVDGKK